MTPEERVMMARERDQRQAYAHAVKMHGAEDFLRPLTPRERWLIAKMPRVTNGPACLGRWAMQTWDGLVIKPITKREAVKKIRQMADVCHAKAGELSARLSADDREFDAEMAAVSEEERMASEQAQRTVAVGRPRWGRD